MFKVNNKYTTTTFLTLFVVQLSMTCGKVLMSVSIALLKHPVHPLSLPKEFSIV